MSKLILFNKPFNVLCQFSPHENKTTLAQYIDTKNVYPAGRLDYDSEGLLLLTDDGQLQNQLSDPKHAKQKVYWAQVEGTPTESDLKPFFKGMRLKDGITRPASAEIMVNFEISPRDPPIRIRKNIPDTWLKITLREGKNRQVRRMCAHVGFPVLRLIRAEIDNYSIDGLNVGDNREITL